MAEDQVPLYLGIPLAVLCVAVGVFVLALVLALAATFWKEWRRP